MNMIFGRIHINESMNGDSLSKDGKSIGITGIDESMLALACEYIGATKGEFMLVQAHYGYVD